MMIRIEFPDGKIVVKDLDTIDDRFSLTHPNKLFISNQEEETIESIFKSLRACSKISELENLEKNVKV